MRRRDRNVLLLAVTVLTTALGMVVVSLRRLNALVEELPSLAGGCGEELHASSMSPDRKWVAVELIRNCGATTPFVTHVNLRETSHSFVRTLHGTIEEGEVFRRKGEGWVKLIWKDATHLVIQCPRTNAIEQKASWRNVSIAYRLYRR